MRNKIFTIPNSITFLRLLLIPVFAVLMFVGGDVEPPWLMMLMSFIAFGLCAAADVLDGYLARKLKQVSNLGKILDPAVDKVMHVTLLVCFSIYFRYWFPPFFILAALLGAKELFMLIMGLILTRRKVIFQANRSGKNASLVLGIGMVITYFSLFHDVIYIIGFVVIAAGCALSFLSLYFYIRAIVKQLKGRLPSGEKEIELDLSDENAEAKIIEDEDEDEDKCADTKSTSQVQCGKCVDEQAGDLSDDEPNDEAKIIEDEDEVFQKTDDVGASAEEA